MGNLATNGGIDKRGLLIILRPVWLLGPLKRAATCNGNAGN
jgi:hypothetical protein